MIKISSLTNKDNIINLINIEIDSINVNLTIQKALNKQILLFLKSYINNIDVENIFSTELNNYILDAMSKLNIIKENIKFYNSLLEILNNIKPSNVNMIDFNNLSIKVNQYNDKYKEFTEKISKSTSEIQDFIFSISLIDIPSYKSNGNNEENEKKLEVDNKNLIVNNNYPTKSENTNNFSLIDDTLIISEKDGLVTFPYKTSELEKILNDCPEKYSSLYDVILSLYTKPIKDYKYSAISRFREAYKLIIDKEHGSKMEALRLATELLSNYNLHPAIITACKNLNELDVYLSCLEYNELEDFHFFKITYDSVPIIVKKKFLNNV